jgi:hypothetical protein
LHGRSALASGPVSVGVGLPDVMLRVELGTELCNQIELSLQEIDVLLLIVHQPFDFDPASAATMRSTLGVADR